VSSTPSASSFRLNKETVRGTTTVHPEIFLMKKELRLTIWTIALLCVPFIAGCVTGRSLVSQAINNTDWPKKRVMVMPTVNLSGVSSGGLVNTVSEELSKNLRKTGFFIMQRQDDTTHSYTFKLGKPLEQELMNRAAESGINAVVFTTVTPVEITTARKGVWPFRKHAEKFTVSVNMDIVDSSLGTVIISKDFAKDIKFSGETIIAPGRQDPFAQRKEKALEKCLPEMVEKATKTAVRALNRQVWTGRIVSLDEGKIMVNAGRDAGLRPGVVFEVFCADECVTAYTGQTYALPGQKVGEVRIVSLKTRRALTEPVNGEGFEVGQIVRVKD
jgi:curli biogenesis system outer membrane secretion channel CsgG